MKCRLIGIYPDAGKHWRQEEKGMTEDEMVGWNHWFNAHEFEQAWEMVRDREAWRAAVPQVAKSCTPLSIWKASHTRPMWGHTRQTQNWCGSLFVCWSSVFISRTCSHISLYLSVSLNGRQCFLWSESDVSCPLPAAQVWFRMWLLGFLSSLMRFSYSPVTKIPGLCYV